MTRFLTYFFYALLFIFSQMIVAAPVPHALVLDIKGPIGPATQDYVEHGVARATSEMSSLIILKIDTPGGLTTSTRGIIKSLLGAHIPTVAYVAPSGARAASAGTYILYASNIAAMAPGTHLGAATPVNLLTKDTKASASSKKALNDARAYIRTLAQLHGRNSKWAEQAVTDASTLSAAEALKKGVINVVADDLPSLLKHIDGKTVSVHEQKIKLDTQGIEVQTYQPNWRVRWLSVITNPMFAYVFLMIAFYGLFFEFANPGYIFPGVCGAIALLLGLYGLQMIPVNYVGLGLLILSFVLFISELFVSSYGVLAIGGVISFVLGSIFLIDADAIGFQVPWSLIVAFSVLTTFFVFFMVWMVVRARKRPQVTGLQTLLGQEGEVLVDGKRYWLEVSGELWLISNTDGLQAGDRALITAVSGLKITVMKM